MEKKAYDITDVMKTYIENFEHVKEEQKEAFLHYVFYGTLQLSTILKRKSIIMIL